MKELHNYKGAALVVHGDDDTTVTLDHAQDYHRALPQSKLYIIQNADHTFNRTDWENELIATTAVWLKQNLL